MLQALIMWKDLITSGTVRYELKTNPAGFDSPALPETTYCNCNHDSAKVQQQFSLQPFYWAALINQNINHRFHMCPQTSLHQLSHYTWEICFLTVNVASIFKRLSLHSAQNFESIAADKSTSFEDCDLVVSQTIQRRCKSADSERVYYYLFKDTLKRTVHPLKYSFQRWRSRAACSFVLTLAADNPKFVIPENNLRQWLFLADFWRLDKYGVAP